MILDREVAELLDGRADLLAVADAIATTQHRANRVPRRLAVAAAAVAVAAALAATTPWHGHGDGIVQRALAAVEQAPILHVVSERPLDGTAIVDLTTGRRAPVEQRFEYWYDTRHEELHSVLRIRGQVAFTSVLSGARASTGIGDLLTDYRQALASGAAHVSGRTTISGRRAVWLTLPDAGLLGERVAVDASTYRPLLIEELNADGTPALPGVRVELVESLNHIPRGAPSASHLPLTGHGTPTQPLTAAAAVRSLGWTPLWLGRGFRGLSRGSIQLEAETFAIGSGKKTRVDRVRSFLASYVRGRDIVHLWESLRPLLPDFDYEAKTAKTALGVPIPPPGSAVVSTPQGPEANCIAQLRVGRVWVSIQENGGRHCVAIAKALTPLRP